MRKFAPLSLTAALAVSVIAGGATYAGERIKPAPTDVTPVGEPVSCVQSSQIRQTKVIDKQTIDFVMRNGDVYRNSMDYSCPGLSFNESFLYKSSTNQLCSVDIITVLENYGGGLNRGASCGLGKFQKVERMPKVNAGQ
jgi:hypothetical protein